jgi:hypothetical protein
LRRKIAAVAIGVVAFGLLAAGTLVAMPEKALPSTPLRVTVKLPSASRVELLGAGALPVRLRAQRAGRVRVTALLRSGRSGSTRLGAARSVALAAGRSTQLSIALSPAGRAALASCPAGRVVVTVSNPRLGRPRSASAPLRLDPPDCGRFFGPAAVWNSELPADAPLDPDSSAVTADLMSKVDAGARSGLPPTINTTSYAPPVYTVAAAQPRVRVQLEHPDQAPDLAAAFGSVPLPPGARPAPGSDGELVVWQPSTDTLWEFWKLRHAADGWHASWGGRLDGASTGPGHFAAPHANWGTTASSLPLAGGMVTPAELQRGRLDHALSMAVPSTRAGAFSLPAQRTDGVSGCQHAVPEGARFRLDPSLDVDSLGLPPAIATMAHAAQRYGIFVRDQAGSVSFYAQSTVSLPSDPYPALFGGRPAYELLASFPWSHLQLVQMQLQQSPGGPLITTPGLGTGCG